MATTKKKTTKTKPAAEPFAVINIAVPKGADALRPLGLSMDALDTRTRELALGSDITINGQKLGCRAFKVDKLGNLHLVVEPVCFKIGEKGATA